MSSNELRASIRNIVDAIRKLTEAVKAGNVVLEKMRRDMEGGQDGPNP